MEATWQADLKAPFIWFGGKRRVADRVWKAIGDCDNYVEPFAGSLAVLLGRPTTHDGTCETVNDADQYLANFWRALAMKPDEVAHWADWPVNEADLFARHQWLVNTGRERVARMDADPDFFDAKVAGWWVWGLN
jgi:site-specific DNA-adenine methylase